MPMVEVSNGGTNIEAEYEIAVVYQANLSYCYNAQGQGITGGNDWTSTYMSAHYSALSYTITARIAGTYNILDIRSGGLKYEEKYMNVGDSVRFGSGGAYGSTAFMWI